MAYVSRDPFARETLTKTAEHGTCHECGSANRYGRVWRFRVEPDRVDGRTYPDAHVFCGKACRNAYHGF